MRGAEPPRGSTRSNSETCERGGGPPAPRPVVHHEPRPSTSRPCRRPADRPGRRFFLLLDDERFGREQEPGDRRRVLQRRAGDLGRVDDARLHQVLVRVGERVEAERVVLRTRAPSRRRSSLRRPRSCTIMRIGSSMARRMMSTPICSSASPSLRFLSARWRAEQRHAAARDDALFDGRAGRVQRVLDAGLLLLHLGLGGRADLDHGDAAGQLGQPLLELLLVVVGRASSRSATRISLDAALDLACRRRRRR